MIIIQNYFIHFSNCYTHMPSNIHSNLHVTLKFREILTFHHRQFLKDLKFKHVHVYVVPLSEYGREERRADLAIMTLKKLICHN